MRSIPMHFFFFFLAWHCYFPMVAVFFYSVLLQGITAPSIWEGETHLVEGARKDYFLVFLCIFLSVQQGCRGQKA